MTNTVWTQYNADNSIIDYINTFFEKDTRRIVLDEDSIYKIVKRFFTKKEMRTFCMSAAALDDELILKELSCDEELLAKHRKKIKQKLTSRDMSKAIFENIELDE